MRERPNGEVERAFAPYPHPDLVLTALGAVGVPMAAAGVVSAPAASELWWVLAIGVTLAIPGFVWLGYGVLVSHTTISVSAAGLGIASWLSVLRGRWRVIETQRLREVIVNRLNGAVDVVLDSDTVTIDATSWRPKDYEALERGCRRFGVRCRTR